MNDSAPPHRGDAIAAVVVTYESSSVLERCLKALLESAPRRPLNIRVVDNASSDESPVIASRVLGADHLVAMGSNRGYGAGVNAGFASARASWYAVINPDVETPPGSLDRMVDLLLEHPEAGMIGPRVQDGTGGFEDSVGLFPTLERERAHALYLHRILGREGRFRPFPEKTAEVDWTSGCAWMIRAEALADAGRLDEEYFMYHEDVDFCRRMHDAGWSVLATPDVTVSHLRGTGSKRTGLLPADGGPALVRYFTKFHPEIPEAEVRRVLRRGWRLRAAWHGLRARLGNSRSAALEQRYRLALERVVS